MYKILLITAIFFFAFSCKPNTNTTVATTNGELVDDGPAAEAVIDSTYTYSEEEDEPTEMEQSNLEAAAKELNLKLESCYEEFIVQKVLPYNTDQSVLVIPRIADKEGDFLALDVYIVVIDHLTQKIVYRYYEKEAWTSDAMVLTSITIDTAPYNIAPDIRAFGIRVSYSGSSRPNPYSDESLSLFIPKGDKLVRVLKDFSISSFHGEWDTNCAGEFETTKNVLMMSPKQTNGYYNILVKRQITTEINKPIEDDCESESSTKNETETLYFKNGEYQVNKKVY